ncbi:MAG TPA: hypothetical protein VF064_09855, partial [Pyrinomonadaceae bacterium]
KHTPVVRNYVVEKLKSGKSKHALDVQGFADAPVFNLRLEDCVFENAAQPSIVKNVRGLALKNVRVNGKVWESEG